VNVTCEGDISQGTLKATITKAAGEPKELLIVIDKAWGLWRCGNGWLSDYVEYDNNQAVVVEWITDDGRVSTWNRVSEGDHSSDRSTPFVAFVPAFVPEGDHSSDRSTRSTNEGTEDNLKETWWNMTEDVKSGIKNQTKKVNEVAYEENSKRNQRKATTRTHKNDAQWKGYQEVGAKWVPKSQDPEGTKTQKAPRKTPKKAPKWRVVAA